MSNLCPQALYQLVVQDTQEAQPGSAYSYAVSSLRKNLLKKLRTSQTKLTRQTAIQAFLDRHLSRREIILPSLMNATGFCAQVLHDHLTEEEIVLGMRTGPGASNSDARSTCSWVKLTHSVITASSEAVYAEYHNLIQKFDKPLFAAEVIRSKTFGTPEYRNYNKLCTVPKNDTTDRVIAIEPIVNSVLQQGCRSALEQRLKQYNIDFSSQPAINRALARVGSMTGEFATVDFSAASDFITRDLVTRLLPSDWSEYLMFVSSPATSVDGVIHSGNVCFSMGNAITFPLQTLIFLSLVKEVYARRGMPLLINKNVAVFGDDVVLLSEFAEDFMNLARECGLVPNMDKSFVSGEFRESCGADWFLGFNVRPVYIRSVKSVPDLFVVRNTLAAWYIRWGVQSWSAIDLIDDELKLRRHFLVVPLHAPLNSGIRLSSTSEMKVDSNGSHIYDSMVLVPLKRKYRKSIRHNMWLVQAHLNGALIGPYINERPKTQRYIRRKSISPCWRYVDPTEFWMYDESCTSGGDVII